MVFVDINVVDNCWLMLTRLLKVLVITSLDAQKLRNFSLVGHYDPVDKLHIDW